MKKILFPLSILCAFASCKKGESPKENPISEFEQKWKSPECSPENSLLIEKLEVLGGDSLTTTYKYDNEYRISKIVFPSDAYLEIKYPNSSTYVIVQHSGAIVDSIVVFLDDEFKMTSALSFARASTKPKSEMTFSYDAGKRRTGWKAYNITGGGDRVLDSEAFYTWGDDNNVAAYKAHFADSTEFENMRYEYYENTRSYLYEMTSPQGNYYYGYPTPPLGQIVSKNFRRSIVRKNSKNVNVPTFDANDRLIKNTEQRYDGSGSLGSEVFSYYLYKCK